jgi:hypothetical protein
MKSVRKYLLPIALLLILTGCRTSWSSKSVEVSADAEALRELHEENARLREENEQLRRQLKVRDGQTPSNSDWLNGHTVAGKVCSVDAEKNVVVLSVGKNDGVRVGYEFTVYRGNRYVAKVVIEDVEAEQCSGYSKKELQAGTIEIGDDARTRW